MSDTSIATRLALDPADIELVGPTQKQRSVQLPQLLVSLLVAGVIALLVLWWNTTSSARSPVLAVGVDLVAGEVVESSDLVIVSVSSDAPIQTAPPEVRTTIVGAVASSDVAAGTLVTPGLFQATALLAEGESFVGAVLGPNDFPPGLEGNEAVEVLITDGASAGTFSATVSSITSSSNGDALVRLLVAEQDAETIQRAAARNAVALIEVAS